MKDSERFILVQWIGRQPLIDGSLLFETEEDATEYLESLLEVKEVTHTIANVKAHRMKTKLKPCDCKDMTTVSKLNEQGIGHNDQSIMVKPGVVILTMEHTTIRIPQARFKMFAEWYLEAQEIDNHQQ